MQPASQAPAEDDSRRMEPESSRQARINRAKWEAGHRAIFRGEVAFPGGMECREDLPRHEDRAIVNRTNQFLRHEDEEGASADRYVTLVPLEHIDDHEHNNCQIVLIGCSSAAMNTLKRDQLIENQPIQNQPPQDLPTQNQHPQNLPTQDESIQDQLIENQRRQDQLIENQLTQNPPQDEIEILPEDNRGTATLPNTDTNEVKGRVQGKSSIRWSNQWYSIRSRWSANEWSTVEK